LHHRALTSKDSRFRFWQWYLVDSQGINGHFQREKFDVVINLAAQVEIRYSIDNSKVNAQSNVVGFINILEAYRHNAIKHLIYASSSSVNEISNKVPFKRMQIPLL
jgi:UDP-glucuronate 4-epimerase